MGAIPNFNPKDGLYQIDHGKIHKYKGKGGTVRTYAIIEIDDFDWLEFQLWRSLMDAYEKKERSE